MTRSERDARYRRILRAREKQEQALEIEIAQVDRRIGELEDAVGRWQQEERLVLDTLRQARREADLELNARCRIYIAHIQSHVRAGREEVTRHRQARDGLRGDLEHTMQSRKTLETYCDRLRRAFMADQEKAEQEITDSYSDRKFVRDKESP